jgi:hypothetical protein
MDMVVSTPLFYHGKEPGKKRNTEENADIMPVQLLKVKPSIRF